MNDFHRLIKQRYGEAAEKNIEKDTTFSESNANAYRELKQPPTPTPPQPDSDDYWETYGYTDKDERQGRGGGRGGKHHPEHHGPATRNAIARNQRENAERNRGEEARINILRVLSGFPELHTRELEDRFIDSYLQWLNTCFEQNKVSLKPEDIKLEFSRSSSAGGQNVNKVETAVRARHLKTNLTAHNEEERSQSDNRTAALRHLQGRILEHLQDWRTYLKSKNQDISSITRYDILELLAESISK
ncbi:peptide chain release factor-like protein [bacterium]|nr:peptide chain release factor-like protein [bacterium]